MVVIGEVPFCSKDQALWRLLGASGNECHACGRRNQCHSHTHDLTAPLFNHGVRIVVDADCSEPSKPRLEMKPWRIA
jgi:hypothetical protein